MLHRAIDRIRTRLQGRKSWAALALGGIMVLGLVSAIGVQTGNYVRDHAMMTAAETKLGASIQVTLRLVDAKPAEDIVILINGTEKIPFSQEKVTFSVQNGALVEVDGRRHDKAFSVILDSVTEEGVLLHNTTEIRVNQSIETVGRALVQ